jgi:hypothetical protein
VASATSCKTLPQGRKVDAIELLDDRSAFYIAIPKKADSDLIERIIENNIDKIPESQAKAIAQRIDKAYIGINRSRNVLEFQAAIDASIPLNYIPKVLNEKNGWKVSKYAPEQSQSVYPVYKSKISISFPESKIVCLGRNVNYMIDRYDMLCKMPEDTENHIYSELDEQLIGYLKSAEDEIRFFANKPQSFLTILTGTNLDLKLFDVKGFFVTDPNFDSQYLLSLEFNFKNEKFLKVGRGLLILAFGLTDSQEEIIGNNILKINGIRIDKNQLYKVLVL